MLVILAGLFCLLAEGRSFWLTFGPGAWGPRFACSESHFDCGEIATDQEVKHDFVVTNTGWQPLHIAKALADCKACLSVESSREYVAPDETSVIKVALHGKALEAGQPFKRKILIVTNDPKSPKVILYVHGNVL